MKFKIGDKVKLITTMFGDSRINPVWEGVCGKQIGVISNLHNNFISVKWSTYSVSINYHPDHLALIKSQRKGHHLTKIFR